LLKVILSTARVLTSTPSDLRERMPFGQIIKPAPISRSSLERSKISTSTPALRRAIPHVRPPIPAPTMSAFKVLLGLALFRSARSPSGRDA